MKRSLTVIMIALVLVTSLSIGVLASFTDVKSPSWYSESVNYAVEHGYMAGMSKDLFAPDGLVTRAQLTQILYAAEGKPEISMDSPFTDVPKAGKWFSSAVLWGAENKIVAGYPDKGFRPNQPVTREQLVSVLFKYAIFKQYSEQNDGGAMGLAGFPDADKIADYARPAMLWAVQNGVISGTNRGLEPKGVATRAQMAVIIHAFMTKIADSSQESEGKETEPSTPPSPSVSPSPSESPIPSESETPSVSPSPTESTEPSVSPSPSTTPSEEDAAPIDEDSSGNSGSGSGNGSGNGSGSGNGGGSGNGTSGGSSSSSDSNELPLVPAK